jgi:hypothetical protein
MPEISRFLGIAVQMYYREHDPPHFHARYGKYRAGVSATMTRTMLVHVLEARHLGGHRVWLRFDDGLTGELDLSSELDGEIFEPLRDPYFFGQFEVDDTLAWPNGADFAPEFLHEQVRGSQRHP